MWPSDSGLGLEVCDIGLGLGFVVCDLDLGLETSGIGLDIIEHGLDPDGLVNIHACILSVS